MQHTESQHQHVRTAVIQRISALQRILPWQQEKTCSLIGRVAIVTAHTIRDVKGSARICDRVRMRKRELLPYVPHLQPRASIEPQDVSSNFLRGIFAENRDRPGQPGWKVH